MNKHTIKTEDINIKEVLKILGYENESLDDSVKELLLICEKDLKEVMNAHAYKESKGSVVVRIPDEDLKGNIYVVNEHGNYCLNPKYIVGYFESDEKHNVLSVRKPQKQENKAYDYKYNGEQTNLVNEEENTINKAM